MAREVISVAEKDSMILGMDPEKLGDILNHLARSYEDDKFLIDLSTSGYSFTVHPDFENEFSEEFHLTEEDFKNMMKDIMLFVMPLVMDKEEKIFAKYGETKEVMNALSILKPRLRNLIESLQFKLFCKTRYLKDFSWDVSIRVRQKGGIKMQFPLSVIKMSLSGEGSLLSSVLGEENTVTFECTLRDVEKMIESLEEIKSALKEVQRRDMT